MSSQMDRPQPGSYEHDGDFQHQEGPYFGPYGGQWMPESLMAVLSEVEEAFRAAIIDPEFLAELDDLYTNYINRPSLLTEAKRFAEQIGRASRTETEQIEVDVHGSDRE